MLFVFHADLAISPVRDRHIVLSSHPAEEVPRLTPRVNEILVFQSIDGRGLCRYAARDREAKGYRKPV